MYLISKTNNIIYRSISYNSVRQEHLAVAEGDWINSDGTQFVRDRPVYIADLDVLMSDSNLVVVRNYRQDQVPNPIAGGVFVGDVVESNGKTWKENNLAKQHDLDIGTLVEIIWEDERYFGMRMFVVGHGRDCDGTPLYNLGNMEDLDKEVRLELEGSLVIIRPPIITNLGRESLRVVHKKQVWLNIETGEFSNSWIPDTSKHSTTKTLIRDANLVNKAHSLEVYEIPMFDEHYNVHHKDCKGKPDYICAPNCPSDQYDKTKKWKCFKVGDQYTTDINEAMEALPSRYVEVLRDDKWYHRHHKDCGTAFRGCSKHCPKDYYEQTNVWACFEATNGGYTTDVNEAKRLSPIVQTWKLIEYECLTQNSFEFMSMMRLR